MAVILFFISTPNIRSRVWGLAFPKRRYNPVAHGRLFPSTGAADKGRYFQGLRQLLAGGDVLSVRSVTTSFEGIRIAKSSMDTANGEYNPLGCGVVTSLSQEAQTVPIGRPIANSSAYLLTDSLEKAAEQGRLSYISAAKVLPVGTGIVPG